MSNLHRPNGDSEFLDDHDPSQEARTDVPHDDADALDALLNRIARNDGPPSTRSGNGHDRPDARTDDHDGNDDADSLSATAAAFHRRIEAAQSREAHAAGPDPQLWETITERTGKPESAISTTASANPWTGAPRNEAPRTFSRPPLRPRAHAVPRQQTWDMVANIGLAIAILLAGLGVWRFLGEPGLPGGSDSPPSAPGIAMQSSTFEATPDAVEGPVEVAPPVATPEPITDCDLSEDIPILTGTDESSWDGAAVLLTASGEVVLICPEEPEGAVLLTTSRHTYVAPLVWPGAVLVPSFGEAPDEARTRVVSLITGEVVEFGLDVENLGVQTRTMSPWLAGPAPNDPSDIQILDLRTMQTRLLSEIAGTAPPEHGTYLTSDNGAGGTLVFGLRSRHTTEGNGTLITGSGLPGDLLVLDGNLEAASWISVPEGFPPVVGFDISPDGTHVALHGVTGQMNPDREDVYSILRLSDGEEIERSEVINNALEAGDGIWVQNGKAFAYINGNELRLMPIAPNVPDQPVFEADGPLSDLRITTDAGTVLVDQQWGDDLATMVANEQTPVFFAVDVGARDATMFTGVDVSDNVGWWTPPDRFLVTFEPQPDQGDTITYQVIDAVTGETVGTLEDVPVNDQGYEGYPHLGPTSVASSPDGTAQIIAFDSQHTYLMRVVDGQYQVQHLPAPEGILAEAPIMPSILFSPDGSLATMSDEGDGSGTVYLLDLRVDSPEWQPGWESRMLPFVPGTAVTGDPPDWAMDIEAGYDFSEVPDGTEFMDRDQLAATLRATEDMFYWPEGYDPYVEAIIERGLGPEGSRHQAGGGYTILGGYNKCAWYQTWLNAFERGDEATAKQALWIMTEIFPTFPNQHWSVVEAQNKRAAIAAEGDPAMIQQFVTVNCQGMLWE